VEGLPKGSVKAVIDACQELVDDGCLVIFGPHIGDNAVAIKDTLNERFRVPAISVTGSVEALGEWFFAFPMGSHFDGPIFWYPARGESGQCPRPLRTRRPRVHSSVGANRWPVRWHLSRSA
jgi:hypothetical protein